MSGMHVTSAALVLSLVLAACTATESKKRNTPPSESVPVGSPPGGEEPGGPADACPTHELLGRVCVCGGSLHSTGFCCTEGFSFSECSTKARYVRPGGGGAQDGSDWASALSGLPSVLERDTVYWLGAGNYQ